MTGEVIRWNKDFGLEKIDAVKYIEYLEAEIEELNRQVARRSANGQNELLEYLKSLEPQNLKVLYYYEFFSYMYCRKHEFKHETTHTQMKKSLKQVENMNCNDTSIYVSM